MNNSTLSLRHLQQIDRHKKAIALTENAKAFIHKFGLKHCAFLTLTFSRRLSLGEYQKRLARAQRTLLDELFLSYLLVAEWTKSGRLHFHLLVAAGQDLRGDFDFATYDAMRTVNDRARTAGRRMNVHEVQQRRALARQLRRSPALEHAWTTLRTRLPGYGFGRRYPCELTPVRNADAVANYLAKSIRRPACPRPRWLRGAQLVRYAQNAPRPFGTKFSFDGASSRLHRRKLATVAEACGYDEQSVRVLVGPRWHQQCVNLIQWMEGQAPSKSDAPHQWDTDYLRFVAPMFIPDPEGDIPACPWKA